MDSDNRMTSSALGLGGDLLETIIPVAVTQETVLASGGETSSDNF